MATYIDYLSAQVDEDDKPEQIAELRNDQLEAVLAKLYSMEMFVVMTMNYRQTGTIDSNELKEVILQLYKQTDRFVDIKAICYIIVQCLDNLEAIIQQVTEVVQTVTADTYALPRKDTL